MKDRRDEGLWAWRQRDNNRRMIALQAAGPGLSKEGDVELAYFGASAFRITSPAGLQIMIDPWRNAPAGNSDWFLYDFPSVAVDVGISTHAHFDHDGLHLLRASMLIDRPVGHFRFADVEITGIADKHAVESTHNLWDWAEVTRRLTGVETRPPDNWCSFDNSLVVVETGGLRILHWGDNRYDPPPEVWARLGTIDVALLPVDGSQHVLSFEQVEEVAARLGAKLVVPHHYYIWDVTTRASTLLPPNGWVDGQPGSRWLDGGTVTLRKRDIVGDSVSALCFGEHVAFSKPALRPQAD